MVAAEEPDHDGDGVLDVADEEPSPDVVEAASPIPPPPPPMPVLELDPMFEGDVPDDGSAEGDSGSVDETTPPPAEAKRPGVDLINEVAKAEDAGEMVEVQEQVLEEHIEQTEDLNDELGEIIRELRRQKGLPDRDPYVSPLEQQQQVVENAPAPTEEQQQQDTDQTQEIAAPPTGDLSDPPTEPAQEQ